MNKFKVGESVPVKTELKITSLVLTKDHTPVYNTSFGLAIPEHVLCHIAEKAPDPVPSPEPVKLYCITDYKGYLTKGKVYNLGPTCEIAYDNGFEGGGMDWNTERTLGGKRLSSYFAPLVSRPAKVGEWVYIVDDGFWPNHDLLHKLAKCVGLSGGDSTLRFDDGDRLYASPRRYLVLDGYQPEPECCKCCGQPLKKESAR